MNYREITMQDNQDKANEVLKKCDLLSHKYLPLDPELILRKLDIPLIPVDNLQRKYGVKGAVIKYDDHLEVVIDSYHYEHEEDSSLFTIGEELGHIFLHLENYKEIKSIDQWQSEIIHVKKYHKNIESQARLFSSNIILPSNLFTSFVIEWVKKNKNSILNMPFYKQNLVNTIGFLMDTDIGVSEFILSIALSRYPDRPIDLILKEYPELVNNIK